MRLLARTARTVKSGLRAGFTLIELLAVILIISLLMVFLLPKIPEAIDSAEVVACKKNMSGIMEGLLMYKDKHKRAPSKSGAAFFADLIAHKVWENDESRAKTLTCPAVDISFLTIGDQPAEEWYSDIELVDGGSSSYAGRDADNYPLRRFPGKAKDIIVADDNDPEMNHRTTTVYLTASGNVKTYELADLEEQGVLTDDEILIVGPESQIEALQKLSLD